jgi:hypothetical protein
MQMLSYPSRSAHLLLCCCLGSLIGCGPSITKVDEPVEISVSVTTKGKPLENVVLTLQPIVDGGQADLPLKGGKAKATVIPGSYTYYVERGKSEADLAKIPQAFRTGSMERTIDIKQPGIFDLKLD